MRNPSRTRISPRKASAALVSSYVDSVSPTDVYSLPCRRRGRGSRSVVLFQPEGLSDIPCYMLVILAIEKGTPDRTA
jgi:hypothetical protein